MTSTPASVETVSASPYVLDLPIQSSNVSSPAYHVPSWFFRPPGRPASYDAVLLAAVAGISCGIFLLYTTLPLLDATLPKWLRPFAQEERPHSSKRTAWNQWTLVLALLAFIGLAIAVISLTVNPWHALQVLEVAPWLSAALLTTFERPVKTPRLLLVQYFLVFASALAWYGLHFLDGTLRYVDTFRLAGLAMSVVGILVIGNMPIRDPSWDPTNIGSASASTAPSSDFRSPEDNLTLFQFWTMRWVHPLARVCQRREIMVDDVWQLPFEFQHTRLYMAFRELHGRLLPCLIEANGLDLFIAIVLGVVEKVAEVSNIRLTSQLYRALDHNQPDRAVFWCLVMFSVDTLRQLSKTTSSWYGRKAYERSRGETFIALFGKLLTRAVPGSDQTEKGPLEEDGGDAVDSSEAPPQQPRWYSMAWWHSRSTKQPHHHHHHGQPASNAKVVNLVRGDTYEISQRFWEFSRLISQPIKVGFTIYYLIDIMGWPSSVGFGLMLVFLTINSLFVKLLVRLERARTAYSDRRAQAVAHFVESSRALKLNGWTSSWSARIMRFRALEMRKRLQLAFTTASIGTANVTGGVAYPLSSICLYTLVLKQGLPNDVIWPSLQLFSQLEASVREAFDLVSAYWKATIPVERVHQYMAEPDRDQIAPGTSRFRDIQFHNASFSWPSTDKQVLRDINLSFSTGLTVIRGKVGSGKSSLLLAALNEMELHDGDLSCPDEPVAYAQQLPWLQNKTIRENIVFHEPFNPERYRDVLHACALGPDLAVLPGGDQMKLEEGGIGLSGGQKARVALARAAYSHCRILLLDDPLAALDHDTASAIVRRLFQGPLAKDRTIVMVTHRDDLVLRIADQMVDLADGRARVLSSDEIATELEHPYHGNQLDDVPDDTDAAHDQLEEVAASREEPEEVSRTGGVSMGVYLKYMQAGGWTLWILLAVFYSASRYCDISRARLLEAWGEQTGEQAKGVVSAGGRRYWGLPDATSHTKIWLYVLAGLSGGQVVTYGIAQVLLARISVNAAQGLFQTAVSRISNARFRYYDVTPTGQLKNRLIADMGMVDGGILQPLESFVYNFIALVLSLTAIMTHQPALLVILCFVAMMFVYFFRIYTPVSRCLRRMEMRYLTPIIANIGVMQDGLVTIRALRVEKHFQDKHLMAVDDFQKQDHFFWSMAFWLDFRLSMTSAAMRAVLILFMVWYGTAASAIGFVLTQTTIAMAAVQQLCERFAQLQLDAVSLERVDMLNKIPEEANGDEEPPEDWPRPWDDIRFEQTSFRYDIDLPEVLKEASFEIPGGSTCAVLGRTGSGKSTIANALLVTEAPSGGSVKIGSVDLARVNRTTLRNRITFIQQDPVLFPGTLRDNLDPESTFSDADCERAIHSVLGPDWGLESPIDAGGKNLSQGQRQLVGIGRAILRKSGLVILDEATASIDRKTAATVQRVLRDELAKSTVITIAHRLEAVEDATWCLRLDHGRVIESGPTAR